jgi:hypothetical protein
MGAHCFMPRQHSNRSIFLVPSVLALGSEEGHCHSRHYTAFEGRGSARFVESGCASRHHSTSTSAGRNNRCVCARTCLFISWVQFFGAGLSWQPLLGTPPYPSLPSLPRAPALVASHRYRTGLPHGIPRRVHRAVSSAPLSVFDTPPQSLPKAPPKILQCTGRNLRNPHRILHRECIRALHLFPACRYLRPTLHRLNSRHCLSIFPASQAQAAQRPAPQLRAHPTRRNCDLRSSTSPFFYTRGAGLPSGVPWLRYAGASPPKQAMLWRGRQRRVSHLSPFTPQPL